jgi:hypothetical protein
LAAYRPNLASLNQPAAIILFFAHRGLKAVLV